MTSLGEDLKRERELRGISLKEIADSTKINLRFLRALEKDQLDILPGKFFTKGILRAYAKFIGLEENAVLNKYYESIQQQESNQKDEYKKKKPPPVSPQKAKTLFHFIILFIGLLAFLSFLYFIFQKKETTTPVKPPQAATVLYEDKTLPSPEKKASPAEEVKDLNFTISFDEKTWIQLYVDGEKELNGIMRPGKIFKTTCRKEILMHIGNAGGISYTINNKKGKVLGASGEVVKNIHITVDNYQKFLEQEKTTAPS